MRSIRIFLAIFVLAAHRLWAKRGLAAASALGFTVAVALAYTLPLYADSVYQRILNREISYSGTASSRIPPFMFAFRYDSFGNFTSDDQFLNTWAPQVLKLPVKSTTRYFQTNSFRVFPMSFLTSTTLSRPAFWAPLIAASRFADHVAFAEGGMADAIPKPASSEPVTGTADIQKVKQLPAIKVMVSQALARDMGIYLGDRLIVISKQDFRNAIKLPVYVSGIFSMRDRYEPYWDAYQSELLDRMLVLDDTSFIEIAPTIQREIFRSQWDMNFDGSNIHVGNVDDFIGRIDSLMTLLKDQQMQISLGLSPREKLLGFQSQSRALTVQLYAFSVPVFVLVFAFLVLVAGLMANDQRNEIAVLRSRGASAWQVIGITFLEACILGMLGLILATPVALGLAEGLGQTRSFMTFTGYEWLSISLTAAVVPMGLAVVTIAVVITVLPILGAARHTIISYKLEQARAMKPPIWQRLWLDMLLLIPVGYWTYLLQKQGSLDIPGIGVPGPDPFSNPALFLVPALTMVAIALLLIRLVPWLLRALSWILARLPGTTLMLAMRQLARSPNLYVVPLFMLMITLALAIYTASVAATLDNHLDQETRYNLGGDVRMVQTGENHAPAIVPGASGAGSGSGTAGETNNNTVGGGTTSGLSLGKIGVLVGDSGSSTSQPSAVEPSPVDNGPIYTFLPISDYLKVAGVQTATRSGTYACVMRFGSGGDVQGHVAGIDRTDFPSVAFWRRDFASKSLGELMNALASTPDAVLVPETVMAEHALQIGDNVPLSIYFAGATMNTQVRIAGSFKLWPTWYPNRSDAGPLLIGNLDYLFEVAQGQFPYDVWIKVRQDANPAVVGPQVRDLSRQGGYTDDVRTVMETQLNRPERQGLFGVLSFGFLAAALFTVLGFMLYSIFSFRRRYIELGVLRALGLSAWQMTAFLGWELVLLLASGAAGGTVLGIMASNIYIPYLQASGENRAVPFLVIINWPEIGIIYALFAVLFVLVLIILLIFLRRLHIFQAVKLGEAE